MKYISAVILTILVLEGSVAPGLCDGGREALIVVGAGGTDEYREVFRENATRWKEAFTASKAKVEEIGITESSSDEPLSDRERILRWIDGGVADASTERWLIMIGHGTYQRQVANFNLVGPDLSAPEMAAAMDGKKGDWRVVVCASSSSPFLSALAVPGRIVVTATKSGSEQNYSLFGTYLAKSITNLDADLDHDGGVTLLEAFIDASGKLAAWYESENRLASEQALLDDNGDGKGTPAAFFRGVRAVKAAADGLQLDGDNANRCFLVAPERSETWTSEKEQQVVTIERKIEALRQAKANLETAEYYKELEQLLMTLAHWYPTERFAL